jgi:signal transduction histidine kinase
MKRINVLWIILDLIFLIIFNAIFFATGGIDRYLSVWLSYGFIHFAYFMLLLTAFLIRAGKSKVIFGFSLYSISAAYFLGEFVTGIVFILLSPENHKIAFLVQICIAGLYAVILVSNMIANEHTAEAEEKRQYQNEFIKNASEKIKRILDSINDKETIKKIEKIYDAIYSSPAKSHQDLTQMEDSLLLSINELDDAVSTGHKESIISLVDSLLAAINERNSWLKTLNK